MHGLQAKRAVHVYLQHSSDHNGDQAHDEANQ